MAIVSLTRHAREADEAVAVDRPVPPFVLMNVSCADPR
jgi:hypothetical protein